MTDIQVDEWALTLAIEHQQRLDLAVAFEPSLHPRDLKGKFRETVGGLPLGGAVKLPDGVNITKEADGYELRWGDRPGKPVGTYKTPKQAADAALTVSSKSNDPKSIGGPNRHRNVETAQMAERHRADKPIDVGDDVERAAKLLEAGKKVRLTQPHQVSILLDKLAAMAQEAKEKGDKAPNFNLCDVTLKGASLFCVNNKGIPRVKMPQLGGTPKPGSKADKQIEKDKKGKVDLGPEFVKHLRAQGTKVTSGKTPASHLKATQNELEGAKVAGIAKAIESGVKIDGTIFTSRDDYVVDGHHRWAAYVGVDASDGKLGDVLMDTQQVDMDIIEILQAANDFAEEWGLPQAGFGLSAWRAQPVDERRLLAAVQRERRVLDR